MLPVFVALSLFAFALGVAPLAAAQIEDLAPPRPQAPPQDLRRDAETDLEAKRTDRARRDVESAPAESTPAQTRRKSLSAETLAERPLDLLFELSIVLGAAVTDGDKGGYTVDASSHATLALRHGSAPAGGTDLFYGARIAPFSGSGYFKGKPGRYGLTFFGPMVGVGKIDPVPPQGGPFSGWLVSGGYAALSKAGQSRTAAPDRESDFTSKGIAFEWPGGLWLEARWLRVLYGALGYDLVFGVQTGRERSLLYGGVAVAAWR